MFWQFFNTPYTLGSGGEGGVPAVPDIAAGDYVSLGAGAWTWFNSPEAIADGTTLLATMVDTSGDSDPGNRVVSLDTVSGSISVVNTESLGFSATKDDHNNGALLLMASGTLLSMMAGHPSTGLYLGRATDGDPASITSWASIHTQTGTSGHTYCNLYELDGDAYQFGRTGTTPGTWYFTKSTDDGVTWASRTLFMRGTVTDDYSCYLVFCQTSATRLDFLVTLGHPRTATNSIYHGYYDASTNTFHKTDGTAVDISGGPAAPQDFTLAYDGSTTNAWLWDLRDFSGSLYGLIVTYPDFATNDWTDHRYGRLALSGTTWTYEEVGPAGVQLHDGTTEQQYSGGACLHPTDPDIVFGCYVDPTYRFSNMRRYERGGTGTWTNKHLLSTDRRGGNRVARPVSIPSLGKIMCFAGKYESFLAPATDALVFDAGVAPREQGNVSARAWRIRGLITSNMTGNAQLVEVQFRPTVGGAKYSASGEAIASSEYSTSSTYDMANAFDGSSSTRWAALGVFDQWIGWDAGAGNSFAVSEVFIQAYSAAATQCPSYWLLEFSEDVVNWTPYCLLPGAEPLAGRGLSSSSAGRTFQTLDCRDLFVAAARESAYRYFRIDFLEARYDGSSGVSFVIENIKIRNSGGTDLCVSVGGTPYASQAGGSNPVTYAFQDDGNLFSTGTVQGAQHVIWDFGSGNAQLAADMQIRARSDAGTLRTPAGLMIRGSNNGVSWDTLYYQRGLAWTGGETKTLALAQPA